VLEVHLTGAGREALSAARKPVATVERRITAAFSAEELETLADLLRRWTAAIERD
jgi:DNA-binding MarR family transcriptional regulator